MVPLNPEVKKQKKGNAASKKHIFIKTSSPIPPLPNKKTEKANIKASKKGPSTANFTNCHANEYELLLICNRTFRILLSFIILSNLLSKR